MANNPLRKSSSVEEGDIGQDRLVNGDSIPDELFCIICRCLLWKPRSCSSCQQLFCEKCIQRWIEDPISGQTCPFRCQKFENHRCPPAIQSILSRINIHCRNCEFGCLEIIRYDQLEYHENIQCQYLSKRCLECEKLILLTKFDEHQRISGLCISCPIQCTICKNSFEKSLFREHFHRCSQERINLLNQVTQFQRLLTGQPMTSPINTGLTFFQNTVTQIQLFEEQRQNGRLPTTLKGVDAVRRAREQNRSYIYHALIMFKFILLNWSKIPYFLHTFTFGGFAAFGCFMIGIFTMFSYWAYQHIYYGPFFLILSSYFLSYGTMIIYQFISDSTIIICFYLFIFVWMCMTKIPLEMLETDYLFNRPILSIVFYGLDILITKLILLLIRFYYWLMPIYIGATIFTLIYLFVGFKVSKALAMTIGQRNPLTMPV